MSRSPGIRSLQCIHLSYLSLLIHQLCHAPQRAFRQYKLSFIIFLTEQRYKKGGNDKRISDDRWEQSSINTNVKTYCTILILKNFHIIIKSIETFFIFQDNDQIRFKSNKRIKTHKPHSASLSTKIKEFSTILESKYP